MSLTYALQINYKNVGCLTNNCDKQCPLGIDECLPNKQLQCSFGYFLFQNQACIQCPFQQYLQTITLYCMDCVENPYNWDQNRQCTYIYTIINNDLQNGVYIQQTISPQLYFVQNYYGIQPTFNNVKNNTIIYDIQQCDGCLHFCQITDSNCNLYSYPTIDNQMKGVICQFGSYFYNDDCLNCPSNSYICYLEDDNLYTQQCIEGYALDQDGICQQCIDNCKICSYQSDQTSVYQVCGQCQQSPLQFYYIPSYNLRQCLLCDSSCARCEYIAFIDDDYIFATRSLYQATLSEYQNYDLMCRQCLYSNQYVSALGYFCQDCLIENCIQCYEIMVDAQTNNILYTTLDILFNVQDGQYTQYCNLCQEGFMLAQDEKSCITPTTSITNCVTYEQTQTSVICVRCLPNFILDFDNNICHGKASDSILYCTNSIEYSEFGENIIVNGVSQQGPKISYLQCIKCFDGYYPDYFDGNCLKCPNNCQKCWQYSESYNYTQQVYQMKYSMPTQEEILNYGNEQQLGPMCTQCFDGYNLYNNMCMGCTSSCGFQDSSDCEFTDSLAYCSSCPQSYLQKSLVADLSECNTCPYNCIACRDRTVNEMKVNPLFNPSNQQYLQYSKLCYKLSESILTGQYVYIDTNTMITITCPVTAPNQILCIPQTELYVNLYCNSFDYQIATDPNKFNLNSIYTKNQNAILQFKNLETFDNFQELNKKSVYQLLINLQLIGDEDGICNFNKPTEIKSDFLTNVFSLQNLIIHLKSDQVVKIRQQGYITFNNFAQVRMTNINLEFYNFDDQNIKPNLVFGIQVFGPSTKFILENSQIGRKSTDRQDTQFQIQLQNCFEINLENVILQSLTKLDQPFNQTFTNKNNYTIKINNLQIQNSQINNNLILLNPSTYNTINIQSLLINNTQIYNSSLFSCNSQNSFIQLNLIQTQILFSNFLNSSFLRCQQLVFLEINQLDLVQSIFNQSIFLYVNTLNITNLYSYRPFLINGSKIIKIYDQYSNFDFYSYSIQTFTFKNVNFQQTTCYDINCIMILQTPTNTLNVNTNIIITNLQITQTYVDIKDDLLQYVTSALIYIININSVSITGFLSDNNQGITIIAINYVQYLIIKQFTCDWSLPNFVPFPSSGQSYVGQLNLNVTQTILQPYNNLIPISIECLQSIIQANSYNKFCLYVHGSINGIYLDQVNINRQLLIDSAAIFVESIDVLEFNTTKQNKSSDQQFYNGQQYEYILITNLTIQNNSLLKYDSGQISLIIINSKQNQIIKFENVIFQGNHLHSYISQLQPCSTNLIIQSQKAYVTFQNMKSVENRATQTDFGMYYFNVKNLSISESQFIKTNILSSDWSNRISENQFSNNYVNNLKSFFSIYSQGSNIYCISQSISLNKVTFQDASGLNGNGLYIQTQGIGQIIINQTSFQNLNANLELKYSTTGGCLFIDYSSSNLSLNIQNSYFNNCSSRSDGGCIYLQTSKYQTNIILNTSSFLNCQSITTSFMYANFPDISVQNPIVTLNNIKILGNNMDQFMAMVPQISDQEVLSLFTSSSLYKQKNGQLSLSNVQIENIKYVSLLKLDSIDSLYIQDSSIINNFMFIQSLLYLNLDETFGIVILSKFQFVNNIQYTPTNKTVDCTDLMAQSFSFNIEQQTCSNQQGYLQLYSLLYSDSDPLEYGIYNSQLYQNYIKLTSKYEYTYQKQVIPFIQTQINLAYSTLYNLELADCILSQILVQYNEFQTTSLFFIPLFSQYNYIQGSSVQITSNQCQRCQSGLFTIMSVPNFYYLIDLIDTTCTNNIVGYYGCFYFTALSTFQQISITQDILNIQIGPRLLQEITQISNYTILFQNSYFSDNIAKAGSCIAIYSIDTLIVNNSFTNNNATLVGAAIYFDNGLNGQNSILFYQNQISNNNAQVGAGIYLFNTSVTNLNLLNNKLLQNSASLGGSNVFETTQKLTISMVENINFKTTTYRNQSGDLNSNGFIDDKESIIYDVIVNNEQQKIGNYPNLINYLILPSGQAINSYKYYYNYTNEQIPFNWVFRIINLNIYGEQVVNQPNGIACYVDGRIQSEQNYTDKAFTTNFTIPQTFYFLQEKKGFDLDQMIVLFDPKIDPQYYLELRFKCDSVIIPISASTPPYEQLDVNTNYYLIVNVRTFPCQIGEAYDNQQCIPCTGTSYNIDLNKNSCQQMDQSVMNDVRPFSFSLKQGYWRPYLNTDQYQQCENNLANCKGGWGVGDVSCQIGHIGALCEQCDIYQIVNDQSYAQTDQYQCGACGPQYGLIIFMLLVTSIVSIISTILSVKGQHQSNSMFIVEETLILMGFRIDPNSANLQNFVKVLTNYFQIIQILGTFQLQIPQELASAPRSVSDPGQAASRNTNCILVDMSQIDVLYFAIIWSMILPTLDLLVFLFQLFIGVQFFKINFDRSLIYTALIYMFMLIQPSLVEGYVALASSRSISGFQWIQTNISYRYDTLTHKQWLIYFIIPMIIVWGISLPLMFLILIWKNRSNLNDRQIRQNLGFFYAEYTNEAYLWEFLKLFEKELIYTFLTFYEDFIVVKGSLISVVLLFYLVAQMHYRPYQSNVLNQSDKYSSMVCLLSILLGVLAFQSTLRGFNYIVNSIYIILIITNIMFCLYIVYLIFQGYLLQFSDKLDIVRDVINQKYPNLQHKNKFCKQLLQNRKLTKLFVKQMWNIVRKYVKDQIVLNQQGKPTYQVFTLKESNYDSKMNESSGIIDIKDFSKIKLKTSSEDDPLHLRSLRKVKLSRHQSKAVTPANKYFSQRQ
ncbi:hypothetical protein pb186bvf_018792 [Paramecium bursaria]